jgi:hypothetical protein
MSVYETNPGGHLEPGWMRVTHCDPDPPWPGCVQILAGFRWNAPADLRRAAELLGDAADWLEHELGQGQASLFETEGAA